MQHNHEHLLEWAKQYFEDSKEWYDSPDWNDTNNALLKLAQAIIADAEATVERDSDKTPPTGKVNRLEVIDHTLTGGGRAYVKFEDKPPFDFELDYQDQGKTLKIFLQDIE